MLKGLETLNIYPHGIFITVSCPIKGISFRKTQASEIAHSGLKLQLFLRLSVPFTFLAEFDPISLWSSSSLSDIFGSMAIDMCQFPPGVVGGRDEMGGIVFAEDGEGLIISALLYVGMCRQVPTGETSMYEILAEE